jgi:hypothetical protein
VLYLWPIHEFGTDLASPVELSCRTTPCVQPAGHGRSEAKAGSAGVVDSAGWATKSKQTPAAVATYAEGAPAPPPPPPPPVGTASFAPG